MWQVKKTSILATTSCPGRRNLNLDPIGSYRNPHKIRRFPTGIPGLSRGVPLGFCRNLRHRIPVGNCRVSDPMHSDRRVRLSECLGISRNRWEPTSLHWSFINGPNILYAIFMLPMSDKQQQKPHYLFTIAHYLIFTIEFIRRHKRI